MPLLTQRKNPTTIIKKFYKSIRPSGWTGSLADIIAKRCRAFETLLKHHRSDVRAAASTQIILIQNLVVQERKKERDEDEQLEQRFE